MTREEALEICKAEFQKEPGEKLQESIDAINVTRLMNCKPPRIQDDAKSLIDKEVERCINLHERFLSSCKTQDTRFVEAYLETRIAAIKGMIFLVSSMKATPYLQTL